MRNKKTREPEEVSRVKRVKRESKVKYYFFNIILGIVIFTLMAAMFIVFFCQVQKVTVEGSVVNDPAIIQAYILDDEYSKNAVYDVVKNFFKPKKGIPFVEKYTVTMKSLNHLLITVTEKPRSGILVDEAAGQYIYFDNEGVVTEISNIYLSDLLVVTGVTPKSATIGKYIPIKKVQRRSLLALIKMLKKYDVSVSSINFDEDGTLSFVHETMTVSLGTISRLEDKIHRLSQIIPKWEEQTGSAPGTLYLDDLTEENTDAVFKRAQ